LGWHRNLHKTAHEEEGYPSWAATIGQTNRSG
jgi:hypothetical protein